LHATASLLGGTAVAWPLVARSQVNRDRVLVLGSPPLEAFLNWLRDALRDAGYIEGRSIRLEIRSAEGKADLLAEKAAELVRLNVAIIVAYQTPAATAAKRATSEIPIVMAGVADPVGTGQSPTTPRRQHHRRRLGDRGWLEESGTGAGASIGEVSCTCQRDGPIYRRPWRNQHRWRNAGMEMKPVMVRRQSFRRGVRGMAAKG
jgi:hypothetical protein